MQKVFYISKDDDRYEQRGDLSAPKMDRFARVEKLNMLLECGWSIKEFKTDQNDTFFVLEKPDL